MITAAGIPVYLVGSKEYVKAEVSNNLPLDAQPVTLWIDGTEYPAIWIGDDPSVTRICRTTSVVNFATWERRLYSLAVKFIDSPEEPLVDAGYISVR